MVTCCCIIPVYNTEIYLPACLDSILQQTISDWALIVINDGSTDGSLAILQEYAARDARIHVIDQLNGGISRARNAGLELAMTMDPAYITFVDADDSIYPDYMERLIRTLENHEADVALCGYEREGCLIHADATEVEICLMHDEIGREVFDKRKVGLHPWGKMIRTELLQSLRFLVGRINQDDLFSVQLLSQCHKVVLLHAPLYHYTVNEKGTTYGAYTKKRIDILVISYGKLLTVTEHWPDVLPQAMYIAACSFIDLHIEYARRHLERDAEFTAKLLADRTELYEFFTAHSEELSDLIQYKLTYYHDHLGHILLRDRMRFWRNDIKRVVRRIAVRVFR